MRKVFILGLGKELWTDCSDAVSVGMRRNGGFFKPPQPAGDDAFGGMRLRVRCGDAKGSQSRRWLES